MVDFLWRLIPEELQPNAQDQLRLLSALDNIIESIKIRHDFETAASVAAKERRLDPVIFESDFVKGLKPPITLDKLSIEYDRLAELVNMEFFQLRNKKLMKFLFERIPMLLPRHQLDPKRVLRVLPDPKHTILNTIVPDRPDVLILLLLKHPFITRDGWYTW